MGQKAAIVLFVYNRTWHTRQTIDALLRNHQVEQHDLIVFSDAARSHKQEAAVQDVRHYISTLKGFRSVSINYRTSNFGLAKSIVNGVAETLKSHDSVIVLEDDIITSPCFLNYMNDALTRFENDERVISIHGYVYPTNEKLPEAFFLKGADCWGWATWKRGWDLFNPDGKALLKGLESKKLIKEFDFNGAYPFSKMLKDQIAGKNDSWAVRWYASAFLANKLTLYPGRSLVHNIGNDNSGTHCGDAKGFDSDLTLTPINCHDVVVEHYKDGYDVFERFLRKANTSVLIKVWRRLKMRLGVL